MAPGQPSCCLSNQAGVLTTFVLARLKLAGRWRGSLLISCLGEWVENNENLCRQMSAHACSAEHSLHGEGDTRSFAILIALWLSPPRAITATRRFVYWRYGGDHFLSLASLSAAQGRAGKTRSPVAVSAAERKLWTRGSNNRAQCWLQSNWKLAFLLSCCLTSTEARWPIRDGDRVGRGRESEMLDCGNRPKKTGETVDRRQNNGSEVKAVSPRHCPATCALRNCSFNCCAGQSH